MILDILGSAYGAVAARRRAWYARHPERRRSLARPVISVGNLSVGGSGKTPVVAHLARLLVERGHRPAVLARGYARRDAADGVTIVSDGARVVASVTSAGDEPSMLARALPGVVVLVGADRYLSGVLAERRLGATVHILDDGFQHLELARTLDLLLVDPGDLTDAPLPAGRLREPLAGAAAADAALVGAGDDAEAEQVGRRLGIARTFRVVRQIGAPHALCDAGRPVAAAAGARVFAVAAIERPDRFFSDLSARGWTVVGTLSFRDHHWFDRHDLARIAAEARAAGADIVLTTEKDAVRLCDEDVRDLPIAAVPLIAGIEPAPEFCEWLNDRL